MAGSVNKVILVGNLGQDPESRTMQNGGTVVSFSVATSESWTDKQSGERRERTEWHKVVVFNEALGEIAGRFLRKGAKVYVEGALQTRKWTDQQGQDRSVTEVVLPRFKGELTMLGESRNAAGDPRGTGTDASRRAPAMTGTGGGWAAGGDLDDEPPF